MQEFSASDSVNFDSQTESSPRIEELQKALAEEKAKSEANLANWQRTQADFINYKRYSEQERENTLKFANVGLLCTLILPILDDYERALAAIPPQEAERKWVVGMKLIDRKFRDTLEKQGVFCLRTLGEEFNPHHMEALGSGKGQRDTVVQELEKGYKLHDKVIRPAKVIIGSGEEEPLKEE